MTSKEIRSSIEELSRSAQVFVKNGDKLEVVEYDVKEVKIDDANTIDIFIIC